jgi:ATP-binding cassette subfamily F protein uup
MARAPILQLSGVALSWGGDPVFDGLDLAVQEGDRIALVGRNGAGKSTLLKVMAGLVQPDRGERTVPTGTAIGYLPQNPDLSAHATLGDVAAADLPPGDAWRAEAAAAGLAFDPDTPVGAASGGERRRAALIRLLAAEPDLMLLDEPTNHLDIAAIGWLEERLAATRSAFVLISHDRAVLRRLTRATLWVDRGTVRRLDRGFEAYEDWRDETWRQEDETRHKLDRKIRAEARWAVEGISARRKRNQGRIRALAALRQERTDQRRRQGAADLALEAGTRSGRRVIDARGITKGFASQTPPSTLTATAPDRGQSAPPAHPRSARDPGRADRVVLRPFSLRVMRGDRVAIVGPNGAGKTTLVRLLTGALAPDAGTVSLGANLEIAVLDQDRAALDPDASLWETLTGAPGMDVSGRADQVMVRGRPRHVVGYLRDFLFDEDRARAPVRSLSGGEQARLLLARLMAQPSNLLVLDEPTNDLDLETLDLLQEVLGDYDGTVLMVSHDRDFIDRVATATVLVAGEGQATVYAGGWTDALAQGASLTPAAADRPEPSPASPGTAPPRPPPTAPAAPDAPRSLSFTERHRLAALPAEITRLEAEVARLADVLADPSLYADAPEKARRAGDALVLRQAALAQAEEEWLGLEERATAVPPD